MRNEIESGPLAMYVFTPEGRGLGCAQALTHGGWTILVGSTDTDWRQHKIVETASEARDALEDLFGGRDGLREVGDE